MPMELVTVATFGEAIEAQLCRATLSSSGIRSFVPDEHVSTLNPHYMGATAGIRVQVQKADAERAIEILGAAPPPDPHSDEDEEEPLEDDGPRCPLCSARYSYYEWSPGQKLLLVLFVGLPLLFLKKSWHCRRCDHRFRLEPGAVRPESPYRKPRRASQTQSSP